MTSRQMTNRPAFRLPISQCLSLAERRISDAAWALEGNYRDAAALSAAFRIVSDTELDRITTA